MPAAKRIKDNQEEERVRLKVEAYDHKILDNSMKQIRETALRFGAKTAGPVPLPVEIRKYTVNRSSFIHKNAREQFEIRVHKRLFDILSPDQKIIEALTNLNLPAGVLIKIKVI